MFIVFSLVYENNKYNNRIPSVYDFQYIFRFKDLLTKYPLSSHQEPHCAEVVSLPYSMVALDHLVGVAGREELPTGESVAETALKQVND